ncbi:MAG: hypothetical protein IJT68_02670 [Lentisphaeria bacterium]|nr:hypothetical protein [Lentisphaeria bacterium]
MSRPTYQLNLKPIRISGIRPGFAGNSQNIRRKFAFGYYFGKRAGFSFRDLAEQYAPFLQEVYFPWPGLLSARELSGDPAPLRKQVIDDMRFCRSKGLRLDLLINATCYGDKALTAEQRQDYYANLKEMDKAGIMPEIITTTSPYIAIITKKLDASIDRRASVNMRLNSTIAMEYVADEFDSFYLCRDLQRDLPTVKMFAEWGKKTGKKICMLANSGCLRFCPWQTFHETLLAHDFKHIFGEMKALDIPPTLCVGLVQSKQLEEILRASWIRPEELHQYEPYVSVFKLSTREADRPDLVLKAYTSGTFDGDLLLILDPGFSFFVRPYIIDNKAFPKEWSEGKIAGKCAANCTHCGKCTEVLKLVYKRDPMLPDISMYSMAPTKPIIIPGC